MAPSISHFYTEFCNSGKFRGCLRPWHVLFPRAHRLWFEQSFGESAQQTLVETMVWMVGASEEQVWEQGAGLGARPGESQALLVRVNAWSFLLQEL